MAPDNKTRFTLHILERSKRCKQFNSSKVGVSAHGTDIIPLHVLVTFAHNGGLVIGALPETTRS